MNECQYRSAIRTPAALRPKLAQVNATMGELLIGLTKYFAFYNG